MRTRVRGGLLASMVAVALMCAPSALADGGAFTWSGGGTTPYWSLGGNWTTGTVPGASVASLAFPSGCPTDAHGHCTATDDLAPLSVGEILIDDSASYGIYAADRGHWITLAGNGATPNVGLSATATGSPTLAVFDVPIILAGAQDWDIAGGTLNTYQITGSAPLTLHLGGAGAGNLLAGEIQTGPLTVTGSGNVALNYDQDAVNPGALPSLITLQGGTSLTVGTPGATSGTIVATGTTGALIIGASGIPVPSPPKPTPDAEASLAVNGDVTLNSSLNLEFDIDGNAAAAASSLGVTGTVNLAGSAMSLYQYADGANCDTLTPGRTFTLVTATAITGAPSTSTVQPIANGCGGTTAYAIINYGATSITAMIAGPPVSAGQTPVIAGTAVVGSQLSVSSNGTWTAGPAPSYTYQWYGCAGGSCMPISGATGSSYQLTGAEAGKTIQVQVTATNAYGSASASSNPLGPVTTPTTPTTTSNGNGNGTPTPPSVAVIRAALNRIGHPSTRRTVIAMLRSGIYRTTFHAPSAGALRITWVATITTGTGKHKRRTAVTIAAGSAQADSAGALEVRIRPTRTGRALLTRTASGMATIASARFRPSAGRWVTAVDRFTLY